MSVTSGGLHGEDTTLDVQQRHIESATSQIVDEHIPLLLRLSGSETVSDSGGSGLVDNTENVETGDGTSVLGGLTLVVVEVGRDSDDGLLNLLAELDLGDLFHLQFGQRLQILSHMSGSSHLAEDHGGDLLGGESLGLVQVLDLDHGAAALVGNLEWPRLDILRDGLILVTATNKTPENVSSTTAVRDWENSLDIEDGVLRVHGGLVLCGLTNQTLLARERDEGGSGEATLLVGDCARGLECELASGLRRKTY